ncbi:unnamed protein product, partial [Polarella glacialis]
PSRLQTLRDGVSSSSEDPQPCHACSSGMAHLNGRSKENTMLGLFHLGDIPPAPGGVPQSEVTLDIDANDMLKVSASDQSFGKCYQSTIMNKKCRPSQMTIDRSPSVQESEKFGGEDEAINYQDVAWKAKHRGHRNRRPRRTPTSAWPGELLFHPAQHPERGAADEEVCGPRPVHERTYLVEDPELVGTLPSWTSLRISRRSSMALLISSQWPLSKNKLRFLN